jgi:hypothetical protein
MSFETDIKKLIGFPEGNRLKYEALLPSTNDLGIMISGFANTDGGVLILGVLNKNKKLVITGLSADFNVDLVLTNAIIKLAPKPKVEYGFIDHDSKKLFALKIDKSELEIAYDNVCYIIRGKKVLKMNKGIVDDNLPSKAVMTTEERLDKILAYLTAHPQLININVNTIKGPILGNQVSLFEAEQLLNNLKNSGNVKVYADRYIGYSIEAESFLKSGGYSRSGRIPSDTSASIRKCIFISYNWNHKDTANKLYNFLIGCGFSVKMDDHNLSYKDHISTFMESIRESDFAILIISDEYLRSENCMAEVLHILKDRDCIKKILPIRHKNVAFFKTSDRLAYVTYWMDKIKATEALLKDIDATSTIEELKKLKTIKNISQEINGFLATLSDMITSTIEDQDSNSYRDIMSYIQRH